MFLHIKYVIKYNSVKYFNFFKIKNFNVRYICLGTLIKAFNWRQFKKLWFQPIKQFYKGKLFKQILENYIRRKMSTSLLYSSLKGWTAKQPMCIVKLGKKISPKVRINTYLVYAYLHNMYLCMNVLFLCTCIIHYFFFLLHICTTFMLHKHDKILNACLA